IPQIVVNGLKMPDALSRSCVEGQDTIAKQVCALAIATIEVGCRRCQGHEYHPALDVHAHHGPGIGSRAVLPRLALPGVDAEFTLAWNYVKAPCQLAGARVERPHIAAWTLRFAVRTAGADDHQVAPDHHLRAQAPTGVRKLVGHILPQIDPTVVSKGRRRFATPCVHPNQPPTG